MGLDVAFTRIYMHLNVIFASRRNHPELWINLFIEKGGGM